jgi:hypothetical protein
VVEVEGGKTGGVCVRQRKGPTYHLHVRRLTQARTGIDNANQDNVPLFYTYAVIRERMLSPFESGIEERIVGGREKGYK